MKKIVSYRTGATIPEGLVYLTSLRGDTQVVHFFLVDVVMETINATKVEGFLILMSEDTIPCPACGHDISCHYEESNGCNEVLPDYLYNFCLCTLTPTEIELVLAARKK